MNVKEEARWLLEAIPESDLGGSEGNRFDRLRRLLEALAAEPEAPGVDVDTAELRRLSREAHAFLVMARRDLRKMGRWSACRRVEDLATALDHAADALEAAERRGEERAVQAANAAWQKLHESWDDFEAHMREEMAAEKVRNR